MLDSVAVVLSTPFTLHANVLFCSSTSVYIQCHIHIHTRTCSTNTYTRIHTPWAAVFLPVRANTHTIMAHSRDMTPAPPTTPSHWERLVRAVERVSHFHSETEQEKVVS